MDTAIAQVYGALGKADELNNMLDELEKISARINVPSYFRVATCADRGDRDQALAWLEKCYEERDMWLSFIEVDPIWNIVRPDPRFKDLLRRMNYPTR